MSLSVYPFFENNNFPKYLAKAKAASLPEGSIIPYNNYSAVKLSPYLSSAVVPLIFDAIEQILIFMLDSFN